jgi:hypothetical protein
MFSVKVTGYLQRLCIRSKQRPRLHTRFNLSPVYHRLLSSYLLNDQLRRPNLLEPLSLLPHLNTHTFLPTRLHKLLPQPLRCLQHSIIVVDIAHAQTKVPDLDREAAQSSELDHPSQFELVHNLGACKTPISEATPRQCQRLRVVRAAQADMQHCEGEVADVDAPLCESQV